MPITVTRLSTGDVPATGRWCDQREVESEFGIDNVRIWSNLENDVSEADVARVNAGLDWAEQQINDAFVRSRYVVPLQPGISGTFNIGDDEPEQVCEWLHSLARLAAAPAPLHVPRLVGTALAGSPVVSMIDRKSVV